MTKKHSLTFAEKKEYVRLNAYGGALDYSKEMIATEKSHIKQKILWREVIKGLQQGGWTEEANAIKAEKFSKKYSFRLFNRRKKIRKEKTLPHSDCEPSKR